MSSTSSTEFPTSGQLDNGVKFQAEGMDRFPDDDPTLLRFTNGTLVRGRPNRTTGVFVPPASTRARPYKLALAHGLDVAAEPQDERLVGKVTVGWRDKVLVEETSTKLVFEDGTQLELFDRLQFVFQGDGLLIFTTSGSAAHEPASRAGTIQVTHHPVGRVLASTSA